MDRFWYTMEEAWKNKDFHLLEGRVVMLNESPPEELKDCITFWTAQFSKAAKDSDTSHSSLAVERLDING